MNPLSLQRQSSLLFHFLIMSVCGYPADDLFVYCGSCMTVHSYSYSFHLEFPFSSIYGCGAGHYKLIDKPYEVNTEIE